MSILNTHCARRSRNLWGPFPTAIIKQAEHSCAPQAYIGATSEYDAAGGSSTSHRI